MKGKNRVLKVIFHILAALLIIVIGYAAYVFIAYHRIGDCEIEPAGSVSFEALAEKEFKIVSWNIGFGAYEDDYGFFLDGGTEARAWSRERLEKNFDEINERLAAQDADFLLVQEVDKDATRSYHLDEAALVSKGLGNGYAYTFAQNYDMPYLFYPLRQPFGMVKAGIMTFSKYSIAHAERKELPIEKGVMKLLDLDRCYSKSTVPLSNGKDLIIYNFHLSAYTSDGLITTEQLRLLLCDMQDEYEKGNYVIGGGDFNKEVIQDSRKFYTSSESFTWAQPIPPESFDGFNIRLIEPFDPDDPVPSCRNADGPYNPDQFVTNIDGFLVSENVLVNESNVIDYGFENSDHNPVYMEFSFR